jgi:hypothetical protein
MPTFYFLLIIGAVGIVVAALVINKVIANAKIPAFVKLIKKIKSDIVTRKVLPDRNVTLSSKEEIAELFSKDWTLLDLDIKTALGLKKAQPSDVTPKDQMKTEKPKEEKQ